MHRYRHSRLGALLVVVLGLTACDDLLQGPGLTENPNSPVVASAEQLLIGVQARQFVLQQGQLARSAAIWTQQLAGIFNQQKEWGSNYNFTENDISGHYSGHYLGGGLLDIRKIQEAAVAAGDARMEGIALVWEGLSMGTAAGLWGDIVYSEAVNPDIQQPRLDPQMDAYAAVQAVLDRAIARLSGAPTTAYPVDLVYNGDSERWVRAAYSLKARFHLHTAPRLGAAAYTAALAAANQGINEAPTSAAQAMHGQAPGDMRTWHGTTLDDGNVWSQFNEARTDLAANERFIGVLKARNDPRLTQYFQAAADGEFRGASRFGEPGADGSTDWSGLNREIRVPREFRQPLVSWAETQLIIAEAQFGLDQTGPALTAVNNVRTAIGMPALGGPITLEQIMVEKWIAQFQNIDVYSDWRRTCYPRLMPGGTSGSPAASIPGRYVYGSAERLQNINVPVPSQQPAKNFNYREITCPTVLDGTI